jgi:hypothetical protein
VCRAQVIQFDTAWRRRRFNAEAFGVIAWLPAPAAGTIASATTRPYFDTAVR